MSFDVKRFQFLLGTPCECQNITYIDDAGAHVAVTTCCQRCWEIGMMSVQAQIAQNQMELSLDSGLQLEMNGIVEPTAPTSA